MILYKYLSSSNTMFWDNLSFRFTQPSAFNDPYDCLPSHSWLPEKLMPGKRGFQDLAALFFDMEEEASTFNDNMGVLCLGEEVNSILMWSHYAENHSGYAIGLDVSHPFFALNQYPGTNKVKYCPARPESNPGNLYDELYIKLDVWSYEKEWRMCRDVSHADDKKGSKDKPVYLFRLPPECIHSVYFGIKTSEETKLKIIAKTEQLGLNISFRQMLRHYDTYELYEVPYEEYLNLQAHRRILKASFPSPDINRTPVDRSVTTLELVKQSLLRLSEIIGAVADISVIPVKTLIQPPDLTGYMNKIKDYPDVLKKINCLPLTKEECDPSISREVFNDRIHNIQTEVDNAVFHLIYIVDYITEAVEYGFSYEEKDFFSRVNEKICSAVCSFATAVAWAALVLQVSDFGEIIKNIFFTDEFLNIDADKEGWRKAMKIAASWSEKKVSNVNIQYQFRTMQYLNSRKQWIASQAISLLGICGKDIIAEIDTYIEQCCPMMDTLEYDFLSGKAEYAGALDSVIRMKILELALVFDIIQQNGGFTGDPISTDGSNRRKKEKICKELMECGITSQNAEEYCSLFLLPKVQE